MTDILMFKNEKFGEIRTSRSEKCRRNIKFL